MDLHALKNDGWTNKEFAEELGYHSATVAKWLAHAVIYNLALTPGDSAADAHTLTNTPQEPGGDHGRRPAPRPATGRAPPWPHHADTPTASGPTPLASPRPGTCDQHANRPQRHRRHHQLAPGNAYRVKTCTELAYQDITGQHGER